MSSSRGFRLKLLLVIDTAFLVLELGVGTAVGSLALVADSFHMSVVSPCVPCRKAVCWRGECPAAAAAAAGGSALTDRLPSQPSSPCHVPYRAMKLAETSSASAKYSYGWQRAEVLGALINSVFLLALCFSIGMEAIARFLNQAEVTNPKLIVAVGTAGLLSNIIGLFLFHDHGGHSHGVGGGHSHGSGGHSHAAHSRDVESAKPHETAHVHSHAAPSREPSDRTPLLDRTQSSSRSSSTQIVSATPTESDDESDDESEDARAEDELFVHPGELRGNIVKAAHDAGYGATSSTMGTKAKKDAEHVRGDSISDGHGGHGHDHDEVVASGQDGSMNMRGVFLHVLGDALGNVGVIAAGLFIWLTDYEWRMYSDPLISLVITCIIFSSALPLAKSASFILLQGVPSSIPLDRLRSAIAAVPGVLNVHELHVWSLSESKSVASVHVMTASDDIVEVSSKIRRVMHRFGVHSSTIQPEIVDSKLRSAPNQVTSGVVDPEQDQCAVLCATDACRENSCCPPAVDSVSAPLPPPTS